MLWYCQIEHFGKMQFGTIQAASSAPMCPPYNQQFGSVQPAPAVPIGPPYNQQVESVQPASAAPIGGFFNPPSEQPRHPNPQQVAPHPPPTTDEEANTTEQDCDWNYICFDCSGDYEWYDLRGKGIFWFILLLLFWLNVGFFLFLVACAILQIYAVCLLLLGSDTSSSSSSSSGNDRRDGNDRRVGSGSGSSFFFLIPSCD